MESKKAELIETKVKWWLPGARSWRNAEMLARGYKLPVMR